MALGLPQDNRQFSNDESMDQNDEFWLLMSLALDDDLSEDEERDFHQQLEQSPDLANEWQVWQELDDKFQSVPYVMPPVNFVTKVADGLVAQQQIQKRRTNVMIGTAASLLWIFLVVSMVGIGIFIVTYQGAWLGDQVHEITRIATSIRDWGSRVSAFVGQGSSVAMSYTQVWGIVMAYVMMVGVILVMWTRMLRRNVTQMAA